MPVATIEQAREFGEKFFEKVDGGQFINAIQTNKHDNEMVCIHQFDTDPNHLYLVVLNSASKNPDAPNEPITMAIDSEACISLMKYFDRFVNQEPLKNGV